MKLNPDFYDVTKIPAAKRAHAAAVRAGESVPSSLWSYVRGYCKRSTADATALVDRRAKREPKARNVTNGEPEMAAKKAGTAGTRKAAAKKATAKKATAKKATAKKTAAKKTAAKKVEAKPAARPYHGPRGPGSKPRTRTRFKGKVYPNFTAAFRAAGLEPREALPFRQVIKVQGEVIIKGKKFTAVAASE